MAEKEFRKYNKRDLLDVIYHLKINEEQLQKEVASLKAELEDKRIRLSSAGSIADAASAITNVFSAAQQTADLYLNEISCMREEMEKERASIIEEAEKKALEIISEAEKTAEEMKASFVAESQKLKKSVDSSKPKKAKKKKKR